MKFNLKKGDVVTLFFVDKKLQYYGTIVEIFEKDNVIRIVDKSFQYGFEDIDLNDIEKIIIHGNKYENTFKELRKWNF